jgi:hypothetical protein
VQTFFEADIFLQWRWHWIGLGETGYEPQKLAIGHT